MKWLSLNTLWGKALDSGKTIAPLRMMSVLANGKKLNE
jgi:hypothetical protein